MRLKYTVISHVMIIICEITVLYIYYIICESQIYKLSYMRPYKSSNIDNQLHNRDL